MLQGAAIPQSPDEIDELARLWRREAALSPVALSVDVDASGRDAGLAAALVTRLGSPALVWARESLPALNAHGLVLDIDPPTMAERRAAWQQHLPPDSPADPGALAAQFALDTTTIAAAAADPDPWGRCRVLTRPHIDGYAERLQPAVGWSDLVLGEQELRLLHAIANQVRHRWQVYQEWGFAEKTTRGLGLSALFAGPSGYRQDAGRRGLAARPRTWTCTASTWPGVVSKYIGETEKNLRQVFDAAEAGGAHAASSTRPTPCSASAARSRTATTATPTSRSATCCSAWRPTAAWRSWRRTCAARWIPAFLRRLRFVVEFPFPDMVQRRAIWALAFPASLPGAASLDLDRLAELPANGGMIHNIAVNAAFLAAARGSDLDPDLVLAAVRDEFTKLQLPIRQRDLARLAVPT